MRVTPAMAAGATDRLWDLPELLDALLSVPETAAPEKKPLAHRKPEGTARELPNGRGFLRVVQGGGAPMPPSQGPAPTPPVPVAATENAAPAEPSTGQLDLLAWRPRSRTLPPVGTQLSLFGGQLEPRKPE